MLCSHCKNLKGQADGTVQSHLIRYVFVKDYMVWTLHGEKADGSGGASGVNQDPVRALVASSVVAPEVSDDCSHDYITVEDIQDMGDDGDDGVNVEEATVQEAKDVRLFEDLVNHTTRTTLCLAARSGWRISEK
jgi:hypothetical protein